MDDPLIKKAFLDCDVQLDLFLKRAPHFQPALDLFTLIELKKIQAFTSPLVFSNIFFILSKSLGKKQAMEQLKKLHALVEITDLTASAVRKTMASGFEDWEDALQNYSAVEAGLDFFLTRNKKDFKHSTLSILTPEEFLRIHF
jgi:predicted nucleic acid-binding protein